MFIISALPPSGFPTLAETSRKRWKRDRSEALNENTMMFEVYQLSPEWVYFTSHLHTHTPPARVHLNLRPSKSLSVRAQLAP